MCDKNRTVFFLVVVVIAEKIASIRIWKEILYFNCKMLYYTEKKNQIALNRNRLKCVINNLNTDLWQYCEMRIN
jgi:hypothetical protein